MNSSEPQSDSSLVKYISIVGFFAITVTVTCMYLMAQRIDSGANLEDTLQLLLIARCCGILAFLIGVFCLLREKWTSGAILLLSAIVLPMVSIFIAGSM